VIHRQDAALKSAYHLRRATRTRRRATRHTDSNRQHAVVEKPNTPCGASHDVCATVRAHMQCKTCIIAAPSGRALSGGTRTAAVEPHTPPSTSTLHREQRRRQGSGASRALARIHTTATHKSSHKAPTVHVVESAQHCRAADQRWA
jgi:hypothetical protein